MECFVRARNPGEHSKPSRERPLYMGGPFFLRMHYISLVKFTLRTTGAGQTVGFVNCTRWPSGEECENESEWETWWKFESRCNICLFFLLSINTIQLYESENLFLSWNCTYDSYKPCDLTCKNRKLMFREDTSNYSNDTKIRKCFSDTLYMLCSMNEYEIRRL